jgi:hypothetical protein
LTLPKDSQVDATVVERIAAHAKAQGLSQTAAQATLDLVVQEVAQQYATADAQFKAQVEGWKKAAESDTTFGKTRDERVAAVLKGKLVLDKFEQQYPEHGKVLKTFVNDTGYGEHPAFVGLLSWLGKAAGEGPLVLPTADSGAKPKSLAEIWYPKGANRTMQQIKEDGG